MALLVLPKSVAYSGAMLPHVSASRYLPAINHASAQGRPHSGAVCDPVSN